MADEKNQFQEVVESYKMHEQEANLLTEVLLGTRETLNELMSDEEMGDFSPTSLIGVPNVAQQQMKEEEEQPEDMKPVIMQVLKNAKTSMQLGDLAIQTLQAGYNRKNLNDSDLLKLVATTVDSLVALGQVVVKGDNPKTYDDAHRKTKKK